MTRASRLARLVVLAFVMAITILNVIWAIQDWHLHDMDVYWTAGHTWREGGNPYAITSATSGDSVYRYAPWFAAIWVPLTFLPRLVVNVGWSGLLIITAFTAIWPFLRAGGRSAIPLGMLMWGILFGMAAIGNIQGLMIAWLVWGAERRSGPLWIALAASLKVVPLLYVLVYVGRRQWGRAVMTVALTALLVAPMLLFDRPPLATEFGVSSSLWNVAPWIWFAALPVSLAAAAFLAFRWNRFAWPAIGAISNVVLPRLFVYDVTFLLPGLAETIERVRATRNRTASIHAP